VPRYTVIAAPAARAAIADLKKRFPRIEADVQAFFENELAEAAPQLGDIVAGTGGMRKIRSGIPSAGISKRGGLRHICFIHDVAQVVVVVTSFYKRDRENITAYEVAQQARLGLPALEEVLRSKGIDTGPLRRALGIDE
jgi:hypothetical protein